MFPRSVILAAFLFTTYVACGPLLDDNIQHERHYSSQKLKSPDVRAEDYRLSKDIIPTSYQLDLVPYLLEDPDPEKQFTFDGYVVINIEIQTSEESAAVETIRMHALELEITKDDVEVTSDDGTEVFPVDSIAMSTDDHQFLDIKLANGGITIENGSYPYIVTISFKGSINDKLAGFYRSNYMEKGKEKYMAITQFEQTDARRAFPCFDEPDFKATFELRIAHAPEHHVLSNMKAAGEEDPVPEDNLQAPDGWSWTRIEKSWPMSTYLVAFAVSDFAAVTNENDARFKSWARPGAESLSTYGNNVAPKVIDFMTHFTGFDYFTNERYPEIEMKMDQIAIPDFAAGAMENWGLVTYREKYLLYKEGISTTQDRQGVANVVAHELSHQWFGDLVTTIWWEHIWLNEGFATYFEYFALMDTEETWQLENQFVHVNLHTVFQTDSLPSTRPMLSPVNTPAESAAVFDDINYNKGGCMLRFIVHLMGEDNFKKGIQTYLQNRQFSTASTDDLWLELTPHVPDGVLPKDVSFDTVMNTWVKTAGYPVINVSRTDESDGKHVTITQKRYYTLQPENETRADEMYWVPLTYSTAKDPNFENFDVRHWNSGDETTMEIDVDFTQWIIVNNKQTGYYRVNYDEKNWRLLTQALSNTMEDIHVINRAQIMDDALALARTGDVAYDLALETTDYLVNETEYLPWVTALDALSYIYDRLDYTQDTRSQIEWYMLDKLAPAYDLVNGMTETGDDSHIMRLKRTAVLDWACRLGHKDCNKMSVDLFNQWMKAEDPNKDNPISPDLKKVVYCAGMRAGGQNEYDFLFARYVDASSYSTEQNLILNALGCSMNTTLLNQYLSKSIEDGSTIRQQDSRTAFTAVYNNYIGVDPALDFIVTNWQNCTVVYGSDNSVGNAFRGVAAKTNTEAQQKKLKDLYDSQPDDMSDTLRSALNDAIEKTDEILTWHADHDETVIKYLKDHHPSSGSFAVVSPLLLLASLILSKYAF